MHKRLTPCAAIPLVLIVIPTGPARAQSRQEMLSESREQAASTIAKIRKVLIEGMSSDEREFESKI